MKKLTQEIESLIQHGGSDFEISALFKRAILEYNYTLKELFTKTQGKDFLVKHTRAMDNFISQIFKTTLRLMFDNYLPMRNSIPISLLALGSYGREQLCVHSDIDLLIVYKDLKGYDCKAIVEKFLYIVWDSGLKLGHRVHRVDELFDSSLEDITIHTAIMESRFIIGSQFIWGESLREIGKICQHDQKGYIEAKLKEAQVRHSRYPISMQPNIKESVGGLRDSHLLFWVAKTLYGVGSLKDLSGLLFDDESYRRYRVALELIYRVRSALHLITARQHDQLNLEYLPQVRELLGFSSDIKLASKVTQSLWQISSFSRIYVAKMRRQTLELEKPEQTLEHGFFIQNGCLAAPFEALDCGIDDILKVLISLEDRRWKFDESVIYQLSRCDIAHPFLKERYGYLRAIFERQYSYEILRLFYDAHILDKLYVVTKKVIFLPQFDGYHNYPVGLHTLQAVKALEDIQDSYIKNLHNSLDRDEMTVLKLALFVHDCGKGRKSSHSEVGAKLIVSLMGKLEFTQAQIQVASLLIKHHVLLSNTAQRLNIYSEKTLYKLMSHLQSSSNLKLLYILTYADMVGVGNGIYNAHNSKLLRDLYLLALEVSAEDERITDARRRLKVEQKIQRLEQFKNLSSSMKKRVLTVESNLLFFQHSPEEIVDISMRAKTTNRYNYKIDISDGVSIEILRTIPLNLSYLLAKLGYLDVVSMEIFTLFDGVKYFKIEFLQEVSDELDVARVIDESFDESKVAPTVQAKIYKDEISIDCDYSKEYVELSVQTSNQRGLLAFIISMIDSLDMMIATAKIHSTKYRARDYFLIEKSSTIHGNMSTLAELLVYNTPTKGE